MAHAPTVEFEGVFVRQETKLALLARVEKIMSVAEQNTEPMAAEERAAIVEKLHGATEGIEHAVEWSIRSRPSPRTCSKRAGPRWNSLWPK
jgi:hypothetical protein